ncbi:hypothetical protein ASG29_12530 [Sphingomonas sp. Leaf412]|uniref:hypothetical protein n=1 Tax=Sphingomonas sp. Leaf412 TaxID=1736370 RepID=UPI0006F4E663|nr:hypothetical protein [Sphingomonas sp. Leaf412]KQT32582.1 hypothetical protein ASG29_12530 [Sphingomonas sp. Leaf412]
MKLPFVLLIALAGCDRPAPTAAVAGGGAALEAQARARGLVAGPDAVSPVGVYRTDADRICVAPDRDGFVTGVSVDYGEGQRCVARGRATGRDRLTMDMGDGCRFEARVEADRIVLPAILPDTCDEKCVGRASMTGIAAGRLSGSAAEATRVRGADGALLCAG